MTFRVEHEPAVSNILSAPARVRQSVFFFFGRGFDDQPPRKKRDALQSIQAHLESHLDNAVRRR